MSGDWKLGKDKNKGLQKVTEYAVIVGLITATQNEQMVGEYLDELEFLADTAGAIIKRRFTQKMKHPDVRTFVGSGKLEEIGEYIERHEEITMVIFDDDLTGKQTHTIEEELKVKIIDRSSLILDIFANRARTSQAKTQVELAQLQYLLPRLRGLWDHLERQRGGIGMRGPGEQEIETDRRIVRDKLSLLKKKLEKIDQQAQTQRKNRGDMIRVALVGYTNVGKSTLMNILSKSDVFAENKLFATLDTTVRKVVLDRMPFLLSDTVGFIRKLPHHLVESFKSTLDETKESDIIIHVVDISHPLYDDHINVVTKTLVDLDVGDKPTIMVFNKLDAYRDTTFDDYVTAEERSEFIENMIETVSARYDHDCIFISAKKKENLEQLRSKLQKLVSEHYEIRYPYKTKYW